MAVAAQSKKKSENEQIIELLQQLNASINSLNDAKGGLRGSILKLDRAVTDLKDGIQNRFPMKK